MMLFNKQGTIQLPLVTSPWSTLGIVILPAVIAPQEINATSGVDFRKDLNHADPESSWDLTKRQDAPKALPVYIQGTMSK